MSLVTIASAFPSFRKFVSEMTGNPGPQAEQLGRVAVELGAIAFEPMADALCQQDWVDREARASLLRHDTNLEGELTAALHPRLMHQSVPEVLAE